MSDEIMSSSLTPEELSAEQALRPHSLEEFVGQQRVKDQVDLLLRAARERGAPSDHILLSGPPGLGKTTLAMIVARHKEIVAFNSEEYWELKTLYREVELYFSFSSSNFSSSTALCFLLSF